MASYFYRKLNHIQTKSIKYILTETKLKFNYVFCFRKLKIYIVTLNYIFKLLVLIS